MARGILQSKFIASAPALALADSPDLALRDTECRWDGRADAAANQGR